MVCATFLLFLNATLFTTSSSFTLFVRAQDDQNAWGSNIILGGSPRREMLEPADSASETKGKKNRNNKNNGRNDKRKDVRNNGMAKIEASESYIQNNETGLARNDIESPVIPSSDSRLTLGNSTIVIPSESNVDSYNDVVGGRNIIAKAKLQPITFAMNVTKVAAAANTTALKYYMKKFLEEVVDMESNRNWYPTHLKSVENLSIDLMTDNIDFLPTAIVLEGTHKQNSGDNHTIPVRLIVNGVVFVHSKIQHSVTTSEKGESPLRTITIEDRTSGSIFYDSFDHSMLLYYTFWGVDDFQMILEKEGGLRKPVIGSISLGGKELITFGVHKDNSSANLRHRESSITLKRSPVQAISKFESGRSSAIASAQSHGFAIISLICTSATIILSLL